MNPTKEPCCVKPEAPWKHIIADIFTYNEEKFALTS